jgi:hypothetical protein
MFRTMIALLAMTSLATVAQASHLTRDLNLVNSSRTTVASFFASHAGTDEWNVDLLSRRGLQPNHFVQLDLEDPAGDCRYDFKLVFTDGTSEIRRNVDICAMRTYTLTDGATP